MSVWAYVIVAAFILVGVVAWWLDRKNLKSQLAAAGVQADTLAGTAVKEVEKVAGAVEAEAEKLGSEAIQEVQKFLPEISLASIEAALEKVKTMIAQAQAQQQAKAQAASASAAATQAALNTLASYEQMVSAAVAPAAVAPVMPTMPPAAEVAVAP